MSPEQLCLQQMFADLELYSGSPSCMKGAKWPLTVVAALIATHYIFHVSPHALGGN